MKGMLFVAAATLCASMAFSQTVGAAGQCNHGAYFGSTCNGNMDVVITPGAGDTFFQIVIPQNHEYAALFDSSYRNGQGTVLVGDVTICSMPSAEYHPASKRSDLSDFDGAPFRLSLRNVVVTFHEKQR